MYWGRTLSVLAMACAAGGEIGAQAVVSAHAGVINFFEGSAFVNDQPVVSQAGTFSSVKNGETLRTEKGRVEVLLTPGVFLRIDENSAFRMVSDSLTDTRVEFLRGAAILDSNDTHGKIAVTLTYKAHDVRFPKPGVYRIDSDTGVLETYTGEAEISSAGQTPKTIDESHEFFFTIDLETSKYGDGAVDEFSEWARSRAETIAADNQAAEQSTKDPVDPGNVTPFGDPLSVPGASAAVPGLGGYGGTYGGIYSGPLSPPVFLGNGFYGGAYNPWFGYGFGNPAIAIYVVPRRWWRGREPGVGGTTPHRPGYPTYPARSSYPRMSAWSPTSIPARNSFVRPSTSYVHPTVRPMAAPHMTAPRMAAPRMAAPPAMHGPVGIHR